MSMRTAAAALTLALAPAVNAQVTTGGIRIDLEPVASGLISPVTATHAGDGSGRLFVVDQAGLIRIIDAGGNLLATPFLDLTPLMVTVNPTFDERGALGLAFHPDYASNGRFFVRYSAPRAGAAGEPCFGTSRGCHTAVLAEFAVSGGDPNVADSTPVAVLLEVDEPQFNHNSGHVAFGPDGFLYLTLGDGGGSNDGLNDPALPHGALGNGQDVTTLLGNVLRLDVDSAQEPGLNYAIPATNYFRANPGTPGAREEIYAWGFRNPYRFSFDPADGRLFVADVGQALFEEVNVVSGGGNYGWVVREGSHCFDPFNPGAPPATCPATGPVIGDPLLGPVAEYDHTDGIAVVGGFVYRGSAFAELVGKYVFGDFSRDFGPTGRLFSLDADGVLADIYEFQIGLDNPPLGRFVLGFGAGEAGALYVLTSANTGPTGSTGEVFRIVRTCIADYTTTGAGSGDPGFGVPDGSVTAADVQYYVNLWVATDPAADLTTTGAGSGSPLFGVPDGAVTAGDIQFYVNEFVAGCP